MASSFTKVHVGYYFGALRDYNLFSRRTKIGIGSASLAPGPCTQPQRQTASAVFPAGLLDPPFYGGVTAATQNSSPIHRAYQFGA